MHFGHDNLNLDKEYPFHIWQMDRNPFYEMAYMHWHDCFEISCILFGNGIYQIEDKYYPVTAGDIVVINNVEPHRLMVGREPFTQIVTVFNPSFVWSGGSTLNFSYLIPFQGHDGHFCNLISHGSPMSLELNDLISDMLQEYTEKTEGWKLMIKAKLLSLLTIIYRHYRNSGMGKQRENLLRLSEVFNYIEENFEDELTLTKAAEKAHMTPQYFSFFFKKTAGTGFSDYVNRYRIDRAVYLLKETDLKVTDIAQQCGFHNIGNFNEVFRRHTGDTPSAIRKNK